MSFIMIYNYNGFCGYNELFYNFEYKGYLLCGWMFIIKIGYGWGCFGWNINEYFFGVFEVYDDYDFGVDYGLYNEMLMNGQIKEKGVIIFCKVIVYVYLCGVKIGLGLDIDVVLLEYQFELDNKDLIKVQVVEIVCEYLELDYLFCF